MGRPLAVSSSCLGTRDADVWHIWLQDMRTRDKDAHNTGCAREPVRDAET